VATGSRRADMSTWERGFRVREELTFDAFVGDVASGQVWLDFASIPQVCDASSAGDVDEQIRQQVAAVKSISAYVERADYFWIVAPTAEHVDKKTRRDLSTYRSRAWCRLEESVNLLSLQSRMPLVVTESPRLSSYSPTEFLLFLGGNTHLGPCSGAVTCCELNHTVVREGRAYQIPCDKELMSWLLQKLYFAKFDNLEGQGSLGMAFRLSWSANALLVASSKHGDQARIAVRDRLFNMFGGVGEPAKTSLGISPFHISIFLNDLALVKEVLATEIPERPRVSLVTADDNHLLDHCAYVGAVDIMEVLWDSEVVGVNELDRVNALGSRPMHKAAEWGHLAVVQRLLLWHADVNASKASTSTLAGEMPLHCAALRGHTLCCKLLLEHAAEACARDAKGRTPAHSAMTQPVIVAGSLEAGAAAKTFSLLLAARADAVAADQDGLTPLDLAAAWGVHLLLTT